RRGADRAEAEVAAPLPEFSAVAEAVEAPVLAEPAEAVAEEARPERPRRERGGRGRGRDREREARPAAAEAETPAPRGRPFGDADIPAFLRRPVVIGA
ncbi:MAG: RNA helicase, partial [Caulobacteraceae bacterium]|nr:RNA helicase [Caulobacteraceae bacterium]